MIKTVCCVVIVLMLLTTSGFADDTPPPVDKSAYTVFNPVPDSLMRSFSPDRPGKGILPYTVDAGHFQYEGDIVNWTYDHNNTTQTTTSNVLMADPTLKLGLTQNADLEFALAPMNINHSTNRITGATTSVFGFGDVYTRVKFNLFGNEGGDYALAVIPYVKAPTASRNIGNNHWEGGGAVPFSIELPDDWEVSFLTEFDILENAALDGTHMNYQNLISFGHPIIENVVGSVDFWSDVSTDQGAQTQYTLDLALAWLVKDNLQLDAGVNIGLNKAASDVQSYIGISQRF